MSREKEIRKMLKEKQREADKLLRELNRTKYSKQLDVFCNTLYESDELLEMITQNNFTCEDARILAQKILLNVHKLYQHYDKDFETAAARRTRKKEARATSRIEVQASKTTSLNSGTSVDTDAEPKRESNDLPRQY